jgi:DNA-binding CsgD family transcriptional regulator
MDVLGRDDELRSLQAFLDRPAPSGLGALVLEGDAGIGKSTLWLASVETARQRGLRIFTSRPAEVELGVAFAGLGDLLEGALGDVVSELAAPRRRALEIALLVKDEAGEPVDFRTLAVAVREALQLLAEHQQILVAIDDVQWLDASSTSALAFALRRLHDADIALLCTRRLGEGIPVSELERAVDDSLLERLHVGPLSAGALHAVLQNRLGRVFARPTLLRLHEASGGNPFFALELARALGAVVDPTQPLVVPETLEALVRARLDGLPDETRAALLLACVHSRITPAQLDGSALEPAFADHVIELRDGVIRFTHPLLASVLSQGASAEATRRAHARVAEIVDDPLARARHKALAADEPDDEIAAVLEQAAALASAQGAPIVAAELGEHALRLTPLDLPDERHRRTITAARAHSAAGDLSRAKGLARDLLARSPAGRRRAEALVVLSDVGPDFIPLRRDALREAAADPALQAEIHMALSWESRFTEGLRVADQHARLSLELAEKLDDDPLRAGALIALATSHFYLGEPDALALTEEALRLGGEARDSEGRPSVRLRATSILMYSGHLDRARSLLEELQGEWSERDEGVAALIHWLRGSVELSAGRFALAADEADRSREIHLQWQGEETAPSLWQVALVTAHRGDLVRARELAVHGLALTDLDPWFAAYLEGALGLVEVWSGDAPGAVERFTAANELSSGAVLLEPAVLRWRPDHVEALLELGSIDEAVSILDGWEADGARLGRARVLAQAARCRGLVAAARGEVADSLAQLEQAVVQHEEAGDPFGRARTLLALGIVRRRARQKRPARDAIEAALAGFEECGAEGWAEKARAEIGRIGGRTRAEGLTAAELRVAALVAEGKTNREVASALFLGERTVASHLTHIYAKLGVRSRTELVGKVQTF